MGKGRAAGRVRPFVGNRGSGRVNVSPGRLGSKKSVPWTTLRCLYLGYEIFLPWMGCFYHGWDISIMDGIVLYHAGIFLPWMGYLSRTSMLHPWRPQPPYPSRQSTPSSTSDGCFDSVRTKNSTEQESVIMKICAPSVSPSHRRCNPHHRATPCHRPAVTLSATPPHSRPLLGILDALAAVVSN